MACQPAPNAENPCEWWPFYLTWPMPRKIAVRAARHDETRIDPQKLHRFAAQQAWHAIAHDAEATKPPALFQIKGNGFLVCTQLERERAKVTHRIIRTTVSLT